MTAASVYQQLIALPDLQSLFYIGANGKIGTAVCQKLVQRGISVRIFSKYEGFQHPLVSYTQDLNEMHRWPPSPPVMHIYILTTFLTLYASHGTWPQPNLTYPYIHLTHSSPLHHTHSYKYTLIGKLLKASAYKNVLHIRNSSNGNGSGGDLPTSRFLLDYTVPYMPLPTSKGVCHVQIGVLNVTNR